jgi:hypothetical protein
LRDKELVNMNADMQIVRYRDKCTLLLEDLEEVKQIYRSKPDFDVS